MDFQGLKPIDYVTHPLGDESVADLDPMGIEIRKVLRQEWSILGDCLMIRTTFKK